MIGIQARSGSTRFPRKAFELIGGKTMTDRVIDACKNAAGYLSNRESISTKVVLLTPEGDPIARAFADRCDVMQGPMADVLARYQSALNRYHPHYVVRITGDCPLIPPYLITRLVTLAVSRGYDYISNVDPRFRTAMDGTDVEVVSARLLAWTGERATSAEDTEHVTTMIRRDPPEWAKIGFAINPFDLSETKLSVDTPEDMERVRAAYETAQQKYRDAALALGSSAVHRI